MQESILKERSSGNTLRDFYNIVFRHKQKLILFFVSVMIAVSLGTFLMPDIYQSNAKLLVRMGRESTDIVDPTAPAGRERISLSQNRENELNSEMEILTSEELVGEVVDAIGVKAILKGKSTGKKEQPSSVTPKQNQGRNKAIRKLMKNLKVEVVKKSNIIALAYEAKAPQLASDVYKRQALDTASADSLLSISVCKADILSRRRGRCSNNAPILVLFLVSLICFSVWANALYSFSFCFLKKL